MARIAKDVTEAELAILQVLWDGGAATIRQLTDVLYPQGGASKYATVQKLLDRLAADRYVRRDRSEGVNVYSAAIGRDDLIGRRLRTLVDKLCGGSLTPLLSHLVNSHPLSAEERKSLRTLIDELDKPTKPHRRPRN
jgi:predicted transcriptional regulator